MSCISLDGLLSATGRLTFHGISGTNLRSAFRCPNGGRTSSYPSSLQLAAEPQIIRPASHRLSACPCLPASA